MPGSLKLALATLVMPAALFSRRSKDAWLGELDEIRGEALVAPDGGTAAVMGPAESLADTGIDTATGPWPDAELSAEMERMKVLGLAGDPGPPPAPPKVEPAPHRAYPAEMWHPDITSPSDPGSEGSGAEELLGSADLLPDEAEPPKFRFASLRAVEPLGADSHHPLQPSPAIPTPVGEPAVDIPISWSPSASARTDVVAPADLDSDEPGSWADASMAPTEPVEALPPPPVPHPFASLPYADDGTGVRHLAPPPPPAPIPAPPLPSRAAHQPTSPVRASLPMPPSSVPGPAPAAETGAAESPELFLDPPGDPTDLVEVADDVDDEVDDHPRLPAWATPPDVPLIPEPVPGVGGSLITGPVARRGRGEPTPADRSITLPAHIDPVGADPEGPEPVRVLPVDGDGTVDLGEGLLRLGPGVHSEVRLDGGRVRVELAEGWCWIALGTRCDPVTVLLPSGTIALAEGSTALVSVEDDVVFAVVASGAAVLVEPSGSTVLPGGTVALAPVGSPPQVDQATPVEIAAEPLVAQNRALDAGRG